MTADWVIENLKKALSIEYIIPSDYSKATATIRVKYWGEVVKELVVRDRHIDQHMYYGGKWYEF